MEAQHRQEAKDAAALAAIAQGGALPRLSPAAEEGARRLADQVRREARELVSQGWREAEKGWARSLTDAEVTFAEAYLRLLLPAAEPLSVAHGEMQRRLGVLAEVRHLRRNGLPGGEPPDSAAPSWGGGKHPNWGGR